MDRVTARRHGAWRFCKDRRQGADAEDFPAWIPDSRRKGSHPPITHHPAPEGGAADRLRAGLRAPRRRHRRAHRPRRSLRQSRRTNHRLRRRRNRDDPPLAKQIHLHVQRRFLRLLLVLLSRGDAFAKVARMRAIEGRLHRGRERIRARALNDHPRPRHGLQQRPMPADVREQRENHDETAGFAEDECHGREGSESRMRVNRPLQG